MRRCTLVLALSAWLVAACGGGASAVPTDAAAPLPVAAASSATPPVGPASATATTAETLSPSSPLAAPGAATPALADPSGPAGSGASGVSRLTQIVHMGQSMAAGQEGFPLLSENDTGFGNFRFARGVHTWRRGEPAFCIAPETRPATDFALVPLTSGDPVGLHGETIANGLADQLSAWLPGGETRFLFTFAGEGARRLRELNKRHDVGRDARALRPSPGGYYRTSIDDVRRARTEAMRRGWSHDVAAITWMQGESEADLRLYDWTSPERPEAVIDRYAADLIDLKNDYNEDIRAITGQAKRIPLFSYQTAYGVAAQAQLAAAERDPEIFVVSPMYYLPNSADAPRKYEVGWGMTNHVTSDGQRWLGAQFAKVMRRVLFEGRPWSPVRPLRAWASEDRRTVFVRYAVPRPPLVIDTSFLPAVRQWGFSLPGESVIVNVAVTAPDTLALALSAPLPPVGGLSYAVEASSTEIFVLPEPIQLVRAGPPASNGRESYEVVFAGDLRSRFAVVLQAGSFFLSSDSGANGIIREVLLDGRGDTVLRGERAELDRDQRFEAGFFAAVRTLGLSGNVRDSDDETSLHAFAIGPRQGRRYPLWNWSVSFRELPIADR